MLIGELAKRSGLSKDTLRHYEALGLLHSHAVQAGSREYRDYDETSLERLSLISLAKKLKFNLRELAEPLDLILADQVTAEERSVVLREKAREVAATIASLQEAHALLLRLADTPEKPVADEVMKALGLWLE